MQMSPPTPFQSLSCFYSCTVEVERSTPVDAASNLGLPSPGLNRDILSFKAKGFWGTSSSLRPGLSSHSSSVPARARSSQVLILSDPGSEQSFKDLRSQVYTSPRCPRVLL